MKYNPTNDPECRLAFEEYFKKHGYEVIQTKDKDREDLILIKGRQEIRIELKRRTPLSTAYGDVICEKSKFDYLNRFPYAYLINIFPDGAYIATIGRTPYEIQKRYCRATTNWNTNKVGKELVSFRTQDCRYLSLEDLDYIFS